ncbi:putative nuclease HARBI1 [Ananas comosus]|uniref:Nuclease HARBI1 n=1 Tax=Ananas comosus TaxID=4615 RepID=A0A6P5EJZ8_ANACO|nr:putative nuclease HARBI1 [Ananas comosus]
MGPTAAVGTAAKLAAVPTAAVGPESDCIGSLDGTHIHASVPLSEVAAFRGRKSYPTQNVLAAINFDLHFTYVLAGWEGSAHDALVLRDAIERPCGLRVPQGKYYLVDAGYSTRPGFISPYRSVRYHLREWGARTPSNPQELFNYRHSSLRTSVERAFGSLKNRFKILTSRPFFPFSTQVDLVLACCIVHNYIMSHGGDELVPSEEEWLAQSSHSTQLPQLRSRREYREEAREWEEKRNRIAMEMWQSRNN